MPAGKSRSPPAKPAGLNHKTLTSTTQDIAATIVGRHRERERFQSVLGLIGRNLPLAYDIQDRVIQELGGNAAARENAAGYKIGLTTPRMQAMCSIDQPIVGTIFAGRLHTSPAVINAAPFMRLGVESEIAVQLGKSLPDIADLNTADLDAATVLACLSQVCAAFELIDDSNADYTGLDAASLIADNAWNAGLILGPPTPAANFPHLADRMGVLYRNGEVVDRGNSSDVMGDPLQVVVWLHKHLAGRGGSLQPGQWISTGSIVTTKFVATGERYRFEVDGLAAVEVLIR
jgi:2-keto-4-pentenoate hydratase